MSWAILSRFRSGVAVAAGTIATALTLSMPGQAFADPAPPPPPGVDCAEETNNPACQNSPNGIPTSSDATGCIVNPYAAGCQDDAFGPGTGMDIFNSFDDSGSQ